MQQRAEEGERGGRGAGWLWLQGVAAPTGRVGGMERGRPRRHCNTI